MSVLLDKFSDTFGERRGAPARGDDPRDRVILTGEQAARALLADALALDPETLHDFWPDELVKQLTLNRAHERACERGFEALSDELDARVWAHLDARDGQELAAIAICAALSALLAMEDLSAAEFEQLIRGAHELVPACACWEGRPTPTASAEDEDWD